MADAQLEKVRAERAAKKAALKPRKGKTVDFSLRCGGCHYLQPWPGCKIPQGACPKTGGGVRLATEVACVGFLDRGLGDN